MLFLFMLLISFFIQFLFNDVLMIRAKNVKNTKSEFVVVISIYILILKILFFSSIILFNLFMIFFNSIIYFFKLRFDFVIILSCN